MSTLSCRFKKLSEGLTSGSVSKQNLNIHVNPSASGNSVDSGDLSTNDPILSSAGQNYQIAQARGNGSIGYYSPQSTAELVQFCNVTSGVNLSSSVESALNHISTLDNYYTIAGGGASMQNIPANLPIDGLGVYVDCTNPDSYDDNAWKDVSGNALSFSKVGSISKGVFPTGAAGKPAWVFNGSGYFQCTVDPRTVNMGGDCTLIMMVYCESPSVRKTIFELGGGPYQSYQQSIACTWETSNAISYYSRYLDDYDFANMDTMTANSWNMMALKMSTGLTATARTGFRSKNGAAFSSNYTSRSDTALIIGNTIKIGNGYAGTCTDGGIGAVLCYNKMLTDLEIEKVYSVIGPAFGLN